MRLRLLAALAALGFAAACQSVEAERPLATTAPTFETYSARVFYETTTFQSSAAPGLAFSADGQRLLVTSDQTGVLNAYALPTAGGAPTALTASTTNSTFAVSYFPNDDRVIFRANAGGNGNELDHVYVRATDGTVRDLTPGENLKAEFVGWRSDGAEFYVTSTERDPEAIDIYAYNAATYERRLAFQNPGYQVHAISGDGRWAALLRLRTSADNDILVVDLTAANPTPQLITQHTGNISYRIFDFTPDNSALIYGTDEHGEFSQAWRHDLASSAKQALIMAEWDVTSVTFSPSGRYQVSVVNADASSELTVRDTQTNRAVRLVGAPEGDLANVRFNRNETQIAFLVASDTSPSDVFIADIATGAVRRLTHALNPAINEANLVDATVVRYPSFDGLQIPGILYRPKQASATNRVPVLVLVHGGPGGQSRRGYSAQIQHLVNNGYAVFAANNRGSSGYGKTFYHLDDRRHGEVDLQDIVFARRYLETLEWVDGDNIGVMGGSYGGYMVAAALAFEPDAFDVGIDIFGVTNWSRTLESIPPWWAAQRESLFDELGDPATDAERHRRISPLFHAANIRKPLLVIQGANDPRVLQRESDELVAGVRANNVPVEYIVFPDEGHGFQRRENRITASDAYVRFLDQHLQQ